MCHPAVVEIRTSRFEFRLQALSHPAQKLIIEQKNSQRQDEVVEKCQIRGEDDANLKRCNDKEANDAPSPRQKKHPGKPEFNAQRQQSHSCMKPVWKLLRIPSNPIRQRAVFVVMIHRGEMTPLRLSSRDLHQA